MDNNNDINNGRENTGRKAGRSFLGMWKRLFVRDKTEKSLLEEEALRTPTKEIIGRLVRNKLAIIGFVMFTSIALFCYIGVALNPIQENYVEFTHMNLPPGTNYLNYPSALSGKNIKEIASGISHSIALDDQGDVYIWGTENNIYRPGVTDLIMQVPDEVKAANIVDVAAGGSHIIAIDDEGNFYGWGAHGHKQTTLNDIVQTELDRQFGPEIIKLSAATTWSGVLLDDGWVEVWGALSSERSFENIYNVGGRIVDFAAGDNNMIVLNRDGTLGVAGDRGTEYFMHFPEYLTDGSVRIVQIASTNRNALALDDEGNLHLWGSPEYRLSTMPEISGKPVHISAGFKNFIVVTDNGSVVVWGSDELGQVSSLPGNINQLGVTHVFAGYHQFYAMTGEVGQGRIVAAWGNKGFLLGTDHQGRDMFTRIMYGGTLTLRIAISAVIISTVIGIIVGLTSGYFGGWVDHVLMRVTDVYSALPFLPIVVTLNYIIGFGWTSEQRVQLIMILIGVLGWMPIARLIRAQLLLEREKDFVLAARALGIKQRNIMLRHILPNVFNFVIVHITLGYASFMLTESALSFLGFGVREPTASWGNMLTTAQESVVIQHYWWRWVLPALFLVGAAFSINLIGDALRDAMDPRSGER